MSKIAVTPREGFIVKDHKGKPISENGALVDDSPVVRRRIREGLLVKGLAEPFTEDETEEDSDEVVDLDAMTVPEIKEALKGAEVDFPASAKREELVNLLAEHLEAAE